MSLSHTKKHAILHAQSDWEMYTIRKLFTNLAWTLFHVVIFLVTLNM